MEKPLRSAPDGVDETDLPPSRVSRKLKYFLFAFTSFFWVSIIWPGLTAVFPVSLLLHCLQRIRVYFHGIVCIEVLPKAYSCFWNAIKVQQVAGKVLLAVSNKSVV